MRTLVGLVSSFLAFAPLAAAQQPPVFSTTRDLVAVDVSVVDSQGRPVKGLTADDFLVTVDGRGRTILSAEFVDQSGAAAETEPPAPSAYFSTNAGARTGRLVLFVVDQNSLAPGSGRALLAAADHLLDRLGAQDRVGLAAIPSPGPVVEFTADHALVRQALGKVVGRARRLTTRVGLTEALSYTEGLGPDWEGVIERECGGVADPREHAICVAALQEEAVRVATDFRYRSATSLKALGAVFDGLAAIEGPKNLLLITEGLPGDEASELRDLAKRAAVSRASLFIVRIDRGQDVDASRQNLGQGEMQTEGFLANGILDLAAMSRGAVFRASGSGEGIYDAIARELSGYYLLGFAPEGNERDGRDHAVKVSVPGRKVTVRWRSTVRVPAAGARSDEAAIAATLRAPFLATDLSVRVAAYALPEPDAARVRVMVSAMIDGAKESLAIGYVLLDDKGRAVATGSGRVRDPADGGVPFSAISAVEPGHYTLKVAALDGRGRRGSVEHGVTAAVNVASGVEWGDLVVGPLPATGQSLRPSVDLNVAGALVGRLELRAPDAAQLQKVTVALEVRETPEGSPLLTVPTTVVDAPEGGRRIAQAVVASNLLPPGRYVLSATVSLADARVGAATRPFELRQAPTEGAVGSRGIALGSVLAVVGPFDPTLMLGAEVAGHYLDRMSVLLPGTLAPAVERAVQHARGGEAGKIMDDLANVQVEDARLAFLRGLGLFARGQYAGASTQFKRAIELASEFMPAAVYLGACRAAVGQDLDAAGAWQTALVSETRNPILYALLADALLRARDGGRAAATLKEALAQWPTDEGLLRRMGIADAMVGDRAEALRLLTDRVGKRPDDTGALFVMLRLLLERFSEAPVAKGSADREQFARYAKVYVNARAPSWEVVSQWLKYLDRER